MKLTPYKIARIKGYLPDEDKKELDKQIEAGCFEPEMKSKLDRFAHFLAPKKDSKTKGAFGKRGTNRKETKRINKIARIKEIVEREQKAREEQVQILKSDEG